MTNEKSIKWPRLYVPDDLQAGAKLALAPDHLHYLRNVLRQAEGDMLRVFNGRDGEWTARIASLDKKSGEIIARDLLRDQPQDQRQVHLLFTPLKKTQLTWMIEKAVELGVTHLQPVLTQNTDIRTLKTDKLRRTAVEAAEQCERMTAPELNEAAPFREIVSSWPHEADIRACLERTDAIPVAQTLDSQKNAAFLIGPEGGFTDGEKNWLRNQAHVVPVSLGKTILRAETAALVCLALSCTGGATLAER